MALTEASIVVDKGCGPHGDLDILLGTSPNDYDMIVHVIAQRFFLKNITAYETKTMIDEDYSKFLEWNITFLWSIKSRRIHQASLFRNISSIRICTAAGSVMTNVLSKYNIFSQCKLTLCTLCS